MNKVRWKSQIGQDQWVAEVALPGKREGFFLDVGAHDGFQLSNSYVLETVFDWKGILIEANPKTFAEIGKRRKAIAINTCVDGKKGTVRFHFEERAMLGGIVDSDTSQTERVLKRKMQEGHVGDVVEVNAVPLHEILQEQSAPSEIDYLSIDIEGAETRALLPFPFDAYAFRVMTVERPKQVLRDHLDAVGYAEILKYKWDTFYAHRDLMDVEKLQADSVEFFAKRDR
ncbi:MAG: FkbM family methyltransferase [Kiloniellales bacterium]